MKATIYFFGNFADGYSQYPDNYTRDLFENVSKSRKAATELIYHRDGPLTYYIYTREISRSANTFIGLCYVFNGILITDFSYLFDAFEDVITNIVVKGELLEFTNDGGLSTKVRQLYTNTEELQRISDYMNSNLSSLGKVAEKLPPTNYAISNAEWKIYSYDELEDAQVAIKAYSNVRILKGENYNTDALNGFAHKLQEQNSKIIALSNEVSKRKEEISNLERQKKQFTVVIFLIAIIAIGAIVFISKINSKNDIILRKDKKIEILEKRKNSLYSDSIVRSNELAETKETLRTTKNSLEESRYDYQVLKESDEKRVDSLNNIISDLNRTIVNLRNRSSYSSYTYSVGASTSRSIKGYDSDYALWLYTTKGVRINHFYVLPNRSGYITIGLYTKSGNLVTSYRTYVYGNQWNKVEPKFELSSYTKYYLALKESNGVSLGYHQTYSGEYNDYNGGALQVIGYSSRGNSNYETNYYQYFYNISYSVKDY